MKRMTSYSFVWETEREFLDVGILFRKQKGEFQESRKSLFGKQKGNSMEFGGWGIGGLGSGNPDPGFHAPHVFIQFEIPDVRI